MLDLPWIVKQLFSVQQQGYNGAKEVLRNKVLNEQQSAEMKNISRISLVAMPVP